MLRSSSLARLAPVFGIVLLGLASAIFVACVGGDGEDSSSSEDEICGGGYGGYGGYGYHGGYGYRPCR